MNFIELLISTLSGWVWGPPMLALLVGTGLYLTVILRGMQFRALPHALRLIWHKEHGGDGDRNSFQIAAVVVSAPHC